MVNPPPFRGLNLPALPMPSTRRTVPDVAAQAAAQAAADVPRIPNAAAAPSELSASSAPSAPEPADIAAMRRFNRFYTAHLGLLDESLLRSSLGLSEARVVYELGRAGADAPSAAALAQLLQLDGGYLSRLLARLQERRLLRRVADRQDGRVQRLVLTAAGRKAFAALDQASRLQLQQQTAHLATADRRDLLAAMATVQRLLAAAAGHARAGAGPLAAAAEVPPASPLLLRDPGPGDLGWVVHRQAVLYTQEYGWDQTFEALVAQIVADYVQHFKPGRERCWVAEQDHRIVGSVFLVQASGTEAKLRLLYVEPSARGTGLGGRLVDGCIQAARAMGYQRLTLWTNDVLSAARRIYQSRGFVLLREEAHHSFGHDLTGQHWALDL